VPIWRFLICLSPFLFLFQFDDGIRVSGIYYIYLEAGAVRGGVLEVPFYSG